MLDIIFLSQRDSPNVHASPTPASYIYTHMQSIFFFIYETQISRKVRPNDENSTLESNLCSSYFFFFLHSFHILCVCTAVRTLNRFIRLSPRGKKIPI